MALGGGLRNSGIRSLAGAVTLGSMTTTQSSLPDYAPVPRSALGPALNEQGYYVGRVERNLYWVTDGTYQSAFLTTSDGVVLLDAPPTIGHNIQRAVDEIASANGVSNVVTHLVYSHHHADHAGASSLFDKSVTRIGHEETRRLLLRDNDSARPAPEETFGDRRTLEIGGERIELAWHGANHSPDNIIIHLPDHDALMLIDVVPDERRYVYRLVGTREVEMRGSDPTGKAIKDAYYAESAEESTWYLDHVVHSREPVLYRGTYQPLSTRTQREDVLFLPLSQDGQTVNMVMILGHIDWMKDEK